MELRSWLGVGSLNFSDPDTDELEVEASENTSDISDHNDAGDTRKAFQVSFRLGGDSLPGQPEALLTPYDGWMAMHVAMGRETTLYPVPITWEVLESLLGALTSRGGVKASHALVTRGPGAGQVPLHNPPEPLDLSFCLENGDLVLDLSGRPRRRHRSSSSRGTERKPQTKAPIQKV